LPEDRQALLRVESFGLTSNNITYAVFGEAMKYWDFFPASDPDWGRLNVSGYAHVEDSRHPDLAAGTRVYGYLPCASHLLVVPTASTTRGSSTPPYTAPSCRPPTRATATSRRTPSTFFTSFLVDDFLADEDFFGADTIVISSASAKTAIIAAYFLSRREGIATVGLTSAGNKGFVEGLNIYDSVLLYDEVSTLPGERAAYVDISGNGTVRTDIHAHYGDRLAHSAAVGMTHWPEMTPGASDLEGPSPVLFFAPDRVKQRSAEWGPAQLDQRVAEAWRPFAGWASDWLRVEHVSSEADIQRAYLELLDGRVDPAAGNVVDV
jgi:hypothetical protein